MIKVFMAALLAIGSALILTGCGAATAVVYAGVPAGSAAMFAASALKNGPRVQFVNDSCVPLRVRYWVGRRDVSAAGGVADIRTTDDLSFLALPGDHFITQAGRRAWVTGMTDAVVRVEVEPALADGVSREPAWFQLDQPQPYVFTARGESPDALEFRRYGGGTISPLPRDLWFEGNSGEYPVRPAISDATAMP